MSRIGKTMITIPSGVTVSFAQGVVTVQGPRGTLSRPVHPLVSVQVEENTVRLQVTNEEEKFERSLWGTFGSHISNMIVGVTTGYKKQLEINGVGYRVAMQGKDLKLEVGFSHSVVFVVPEAVSASVEKNVISLESNDKDLLGQIASEIRAIKKPEPYKGKGIKYSDEIIRRKAGKTAKSA